MQRSIPNFDLISYPQSLQRLILFSFIFFVSIISYAQPELVEEEHTLALSQKSMVVPPSAEASQLGKYGEYEVNAYTGVPSISVPIYTIQGRELTCNIGLTYNASGIKVSDAPTAVGSGWSMTGVPMVSRAVIGDVDLQDNYFLKAIDIINGFHADAMPSFDEYEFLYSVASGDTETQPDMFHYTLLDRSGKFYIRPDKKIIQIGNTDLEIEVQFNEIIWPTSLGDVLSIKITDEYGTVYNFDVTEHTRFEYDDVNGVDTRLQRSSNFIREYNSSFYVGKIESRDKSENLTFLYSTQATQKSVPYNPALYNSQVIRNCTNAINNNPAVTNYGAPIKEEFIHDKKTLLNIAYNTNQEAESLRFERSGVNCTHKYEDDMKIDKISLYKIGNNIKHWDLKYHCETGRLTLDTVQEFDANEDISIPPYDFDYDSQVLPHFTSTKIDHWGYHNNNSSVAFLPNMNWDTNEINLTNRDADDIKMKAGSLTKITYPTGGYTEFDFEANKRTVSRQQAQWYPILSQFTGNEIRHESCSLAGGDCCMIIDGDPDVSFNDETLFISQKMIEDGYWNISAHFYDCEIGGNQLLENDVFVNQRTGVGIEFEIEVYTADCSQLLGKFLVDDASLEHYNHRIKFEDIPNFNVTDEGFYRIKIFGINTHVRIDWEEFVTRAIHTDVSIGGLRVDEIRTYDQDGTQILEKAYNYDYPNGNSSGKLFTTPQYVRQSSYEYWPVNAQGGNQTEPDYVCGITTLTANSVNELGQSQGSPIGYSRVEESIVTNFANDEALAGSTVYNYHNVSFEPNVMDPVYNGKLISVEQVNKDGNVVLRTNYGYSFEDNSHKRGEIFQGYSVVPSGIQDNKIYHYKNGTHYVFTEEIDDAGVAPKIVRTKLERKSQKIFEQTYVYPTFEETEQIFYNNSGNLNGTLVTRKDFVYDSDNHLQRTQESITNSNGEKYTTKYYYTDEYTLQESSEITDTDIKPYLYGQNKILPAWKTEQYYEQAGVEVLIDGTKTIWKNFDQLQETILPNKIFRYEASWDQGGTITDNSWELQYEILKYDYDHDLPEEIKFDGWTDKHIYEYTETGKLDNQSFKDFDWDYNYNSTTDQLSSITDIDGQITNYSFDGLLRLDHTSERVNRITTDIEYKYELSGNYIRNKNEYIENPDVSTTPVVAFDTKQYFDGIGRPTSIEKLGYADDDSDVTQEITYNTRGLKDQEIDPFGNSVSYTYLADPLNRVESVTDRMVFTSNKEYNTNTSGEVNGYAANTLYKETTIDPDELSFTVYTDKLGRKVMTRQSGDDQNADTYYEYDKKSRLIKIIPPDAKASDLDLIYKYEYDGADNILKSKFPDKGRVLYMYDDRDLQIGVKDILMFANGKDWLVSEYDDYGRLKEQGFGTITGTTTNISETLITNSYDGVGSSNPGAPINKGRLNKSVVNILNGFNAGSDNRTTYIDYDNFGRISFEAINSASFGSESFLYSYDMADNQIAINHVIPATSTTLGNTFDNESRLKSQLLFVDGNSKSIITDITYADDDVIKSKNLRNIINGETINYSYNNNRWLSKIYMGNTNYNNTAPACTNNGSSSRSSAPLFDFNIHYNTTDNVVNGVPRKNGNISNISWEQAGFDIMKYGFEYDFLNRITKANSSQNNSFGTEYTYEDKRGNISTIKRNGYIYDGSCYNKETIDNIKIEYAAGTNQIETISSLSCPNVENVPTPDQTGIYGVHTLISSDGTPDDGETIEFTSENNIELLPGFNYTSDGTGSFHAYIANCPSNNLLSAVPNNNQAGVATPNPTLSYNYDDNGNMIFDPNKGMFIFYNHLNLPYKVIKNNGDEIKWLYTADGQKLRKSTTQNGTTETKDYYSEIEVHTNGFDVHHSEGKVSEENGSLTWVYHITDHLGNVRLAYNQGFANFLTIVQNNHYYPFGMQMNGPWSEVGPNYKNDYLYNGKELNKDLGLNWANYGFRFYDASIGRFTGVDPISDQFAHLSTYNYASNNPIVNIDLWGLQGMNFNTGDVDRMQNYFQENAFRTTGKDDCMTCHIKGVETLTNSSIPRGDNSDGNNSIVRQRSDMQDAGLAGDTHTISFLDSNGNKAFTAGQAEKMDGSVANTANSLSDKTENSVFGVSVADGYHTMTLTVNTENLAGPTPDGSALTATTYTLSDQNRGNFTTENGSEIDNTLTNWVKASTENFPANVQIHQIVNPDDK